MSTYLFIVLFLIPCILADNEKRGSVPGAILSDGQITIDFDDYDTTADFHCQSCYNFYLNEDVDEDWHFRVYYRWFNEIQNSTECCNNFIFDTSKCSSSCDNHVIFLTKPYLKINSNANLTNGIEYAGILGGSGMTTSCVPPGTDSIPCAYTRFTYEFITEEQQVRVAANTTMTVKANSIHIKIRVYGGWPWNSASTGMRLRLGAGASNSWVTGYRIFPQNIDVTSVQTDFTGFGFEVVKRLARMDFATVATIDDTKVVPVKLSAPNRHEYDPSNKYVFVDIPKFTDSFEYHYFSYIYPKDLSGSGVVSVSYALMALVALLFLLI